MKNWINQCHFGDCLETLRQMPDGIAQTCVTSPPYFGLRDYKAGDAEIGKEKTPAEFVAALVAVFREVKRVLRDDGTAWVNMGDTYGKGKQLLGIPWRLAFALQDDGWILRQEIIWAKPNPMPESVTDRCTKSHESIFLLAKSESYYCDMGAIKEPAIKGAAGSDFHTGKTAEHQLGRSSDVERIDDGTRNKRSVWTVATVPYKGAHFATFPPALIEPCILAGAPSGGVVLDPFFGSGTSGEVAQNLGRKFIGCELNPAFRVLQDERLCQPSFEFSDAA